MNGQFHTTIAFHGGGPVMQHILVFLFGALVLWFTRTRTRFLNKLAAEGTVPGVVSAVTRKYGPAYGSRTTWYEVVVQYTDEHGQDQTLTQSAPGSGGWKPAVGSTVHLYRRNLKPGLVTTRINDPASVVIAECELRADRFILYLAYAILAAATVWAVLDLLT